MSDNRELKAAVKEWRDARQAMFDVSSDWWQKKNDVFPPGILNRCANAEDSLMIIARTLK